MATGKEQAIKITAPNKLSRDEIDKMIKEAEQFAEADRKKKEEVETRNQADQLVYSTERALKDVGDKIDPQEKAKVEGHLLELKNAIKSGTIDEIKQKMETLIQASHKLAEEMYKKAQAEQSNSGGESASSAGGAGEQTAGESASDAGSSGPDDVIDAEFKEE